nr:cupin [Geodermatophilaceae bacterium]
ITLVLRGVVRVEHADGYVDVAAVQAVLTKAGDTIRYTTPYAEGAEYVAICVPAFSPELAARAE